MFTGENNISGEERDAGALIYTRSTIGSALLAFVLARGNPDGASATPRI
nr:hypothetical protein [Candidatus Sigynarchaeota archaeon]